MTTRLFIYGTLRKGSRNSMHALLARDARFEGYAQISGRLYQLGEYPGLVPAEEPGTRVRGEVYVLENLPEVLARLDEYEGCGPNEPKPHEFVREQCEVALETGEKVLAWVYWYTGTVAGKDVILSGDYCSLTEASASGQQEMSGSRR